MASITPISQSKPLLKTPDFGAIKGLQPQFLANPIRDFSQRSNFLTKKFNMVLRASASTSANTAAAEKPKKRYPGEAKGFVEEMRFVAMKLHTKGQAREGEKEPEGREEQPVAKWDPTLEGYLKFLVDSKLVFDTLEKIVENPPFPECEFLFLQLYPYHLFP